MEKSNQALRHRLATMECSRVAIVRGIPRRDGETASGLKAAVKEVIDKVSPGGLDIEFEAERCALNAVRLETSLLQHKKRLLLQNPKLKAHGVSVAAFVPDELKANRQRFKGAAASLWRAGLHPRYEDAGDREKLMFGPKGTRKEFTVEDLDRGVQPWAQQASVGGGTSGGERPASEWQQRSQYQRSPASGRSQQQRARQRTGQRPQEVPPGPPPFPPPPPVEEPPTGAAPPAASTDGDAEMAARLQADIDRVDAEGSFASVASASNQWQHPKRPIKSRRNRQRQQEPEQRQQQEPEQQQQQEPETDCLDTYSDDDVMPAAPALSQSGTQARASKPASHGDAPPASNTAGGRQPRRSRSPRQVKSVGVPAQVLQRAKAAEAAQQQQERSKKAPQRRRKAAAAEAHTNTDDAAASDQAAAASTLRTAPGKEQQASAMPTANSACVAGKGPAAGTRSAKSLPSALEAMAPAPSNQPATAPVSTTGTLDATSKQPSNLPAAAVDGAASSSPRPASAESLPESSVTLRAGGKRPRPHFFDPLLHPEEAATAEDYAAIEKAQLEAQEAALREAPGDTEMAPAADTPRLAHSPARPSDDFSPQRPTRVLRGSSQPEASPEHSRQALSRPEAATAPQAPFPQSQDVVRNLDTSFVQTTMRQSATPSSAATATRQHTTTPSGTQC